ncbi:peptide chain release factor N(5)-glutamine methyltransferase [Propioniciclava soli]|uniref:peptide chain release factor N(5)-glutamine methyltransferase n=1 Tax=Propioniciclava soli TaxID=2775081 RepID=UPI001E5FA01E
MRPSALVARVSAALGSAAEARTLVAHALGTEPARLPLAPDATPAQIDRLDALVGRRHAGEPVQHLTGEAFFRTVRVAVGPGVFVPRPETEVMTGWALDRLAEGNTAVPRVVELCAGSGAISLALVTERPGLDAHAVEFSADAVGYLRRNLAGTGVTVVHGDMADAFGELDGTVDLVIANPPYVPLGHWADMPADVRDHDPLEALVSGEDGLDAMRVVARVAARLLRPGGWVCAEHAEVQERSAPEVFVRHGGFVRVRDERDLLGRPRFVTAVRAGRMAP